MDVTRGGRAFEFSIHLVPIPVDGGWTGNTFSFWFHGWWLAQFLFLLPTYLPTYLLTYLPTNQKPSGPFLLTC